MQLRRVAVICDIHGNLPALDAVLADIRAADVDRIVMAGDALPGPMPGATLDRLLALDVPLDCIQGNGDRVVLEQIAGRESAEVPPAFRDVIRWNASELSANQQTAVASWPQTLRLEIAGLGEVFVCHATPRNDTEIFTRNTPEDRLQPIFDAVHAAIVVCGHTHMQFDRLIGTTRVVNAGSVGMPFMAPGAYWLLLGPEVELRKTPYDFAAAAELVRRSGYPDSANFAANNVLNPPAEEAMLQLFAKAELT